MSKIKFILNKKQVEVDLNPSLRLLDVLRNELNLKGSKEGCGEGECGACSVLIDGHIANSCITPLANINHKEVVTIEGFKETLQYQRLEEAMTEEGGSQCGICSPGMMIAAQSLLSKNPHPTEEEVRYAISGNLCRCTGYNMIVKAILRASKRGDGLW